MDPWCDRKRRAITRKGLGAPIRVSWSLKAYAISAPLPKQLIEAGLGNSFFFLGRRFIHSAKRRFGRTPSPTPSNKAGGQDPGSGAVPAGTIPDFQLVQNLAGSRLKGQGVLDEIFGGEDNYPNCAEAGQRSFGRGQGGQTSIVVPLTYIAKRAHTRRDPGMSRDFSRRRSLEKPDGPKTPRMGREVCQGQSITRLADRALDRPRFYSGTLHYLKAVVRRQHGSDA